jgi:hypothetical protein
MKAGLTIAACIVGTTNFLIFGFMLYHMQAVGPDGMPVDSYDAIVTLVTILAVILGAVALGLAAAAFFGYQALEAVMLRRADELVSERFENLKQSQPPEGAGAAPTLPAQAEEEKKI